MHRVVFVPAMPDCRNRKAPNGQGRLGGHEMERFRIVQSDAPRHCRESVRRMNGGKGRQKQRESCNDLALQPLALQQVIDHAAEITAGRYQNVRTSYTKSTSE